jgi:hypothetical protein
MSIRLSFVFLLITSIVALGGCRTFTPPAHEARIDADQMYQFDYDATRRAAFVIPEDARDKVRILAEPSPDVAMSSVVELSSKLDYKEIGAEASAKITEGIIQLGRRTQAVMILRECFYRVGEQYLNGALTQDEVAEMDKLIIEAVRKVALGEMASGAAELVRSAEAYNQFRTRDFQPSRVEPSPELKGILDQILKELQRD